MASWARGPPLRCGQTPRLCGRCIAAEPLAKLRPVVLEKLGDRPTLVAADRNSAGRLRRHSGSARVVIVNEPAYRPPARPATGCGQITGIINGSGEFAPPRMEGTAIDVWAKWWAPLMKPKRESFWQITRCRPTAALPVKRSGAHRPHRVFAVFRRFVVPWHGGASVFSQ